MSKYHVHDVHYTALLAPLKGGIARTQVHFGAVNEIYSEMRISIKFRSACIEMTYIEVNGRMKSASEREGHSREFMEMTAEDIQELYKKF